MADSFSGGAPHRAANEWTLWIVAASCALHPIEEYFTGWQRWASQTLGIVMPTALFVFMNAALLVAAVSCARIGWRRPTLSLIIPAATLVNAVFFHILPTVVQHKVSPGVYTATLLYLPFSLWAFIGARHDGVAARAMVAASVAGTFLMLAVVFGARSLNGPVAQ